MLLVADPEGVAGYDRLLESFGFESWHYVESRVLHGANWKLAFDAQGELSVRAALEGGAPRGIAVLIGPEGGLSDTELSLCDAARFTRIGLGPRILRTETAPLVALTAVQLLWGDLSNYPV